MICIAEIEEKVGYFYKEFFLKKEAFLRSNQLVENELVFVSKLKFKKQSFDAIFDDILCRWN